MKPVQELNVELCLGLGRGCNRGDTNHCVFSSKEDSENLPFLWFHKIQTIGYKKDPQEKIEIYYGLCLYTKAKAN